MLACACVLFLIPQAWVRGDVKVEMEVATALAEKSDAFQLRDLPTLAALMDQKAPGTNPQIATNELALQRDSQLLEENSLSLLLQQCEVDCKAWRIYQSKLANYNKAIYSKKMEWSLQRHTHSQRAAEDYMRNNCKLLHFSRPDAVWGDVSQYMREICSKHMLEASNVIIVAIVNWVAPCTLKSEDLELQANLIALIAGNNDKNIAIIINPQFCYTRGSLYLSEAMVTNLLASRALNFDHKWGLPFAAKADSRDRRPLLYDGRVVVPNGTKEGEFFWKDCSVMKGRTETATMLSAKALQSIEDMAETAVPTTTDIDGTVKGAAKFAQIGQDAMEKVVDGLLDGVTVDQRHAIIFWEVNMGWGNLFDAVLVKRAGWNFPAYYLSATSDTMQHEWLGHTKMQHIKGLHLEGTLSVPGYTHMPATMPADQLEDPPTLPTLNKLVAISGTKAGNPQEQVLSLCMPDPLIKTWYHHATQGERFKTYLDTFHDEFGVVAAPVAEENKRKRDEPDTPRKSRKVNPDSIRLTENLPALTELAAVPLNQKGQQGLTMKLHTGNTIWLVNDSKGEICLPEGALLAGFGKGRFKLDVEDNIIDKAYLFDIGSQDTLVWHGNKLQTVLEVVLERRKTDPNCGVAYHELTEASSGSVGSFSLTRKHNVYFLPEPGSAEKPSQMSVATMIPKEKWTGADYCDIVWATKWAVNGLTPVRPIVLMTAAANIGTGRTLLIA